jgi:hypothetical protein
LGVDVLSTVGNIDDVPVNKVTLGVDVSILVVAAVDFDLMRAMMIECLLAKCLNIDDLLSVVIIVVHLLRAGLPNEVRSHDFSLLLQVACALARRDAVPCRSTDTGARIDLLVSELFETGILVWLRRLAIHIVGLLLLRRLDVSYWRMRDNYINKIF